MVLNYYGFKLKIKDVMKASAIEFFQMNKLIKNFGLSQKDYDDKILKFSAKNGTYPYCRIDILVKVADRFFSKKIKTQRTTPNTPWLGKNVFATGRRRYIDSDNPGSPLDSEIVKKGLALIGAGFPMPLVERGLYDEEWHYDIDVRIPSSASDVVAHGVVLSGIILSEDGHPQFMIFHDPNDPQNIARSFSWVDQSRYSAFMFIGRKLSQKEVNNKALPGGGLLPAPRRERLYRQRLKH